MQTPNLIYYAALLLWPFFTYWLFVKKDRETAVILSIFLPYLFLPAPPIDWVPIDPPILPPLDKLVVPTLSLFLVLLIRRERFQFLPSYGYLRFICLAFLLSPLFTYLTNTDPQYFGPRTLPGMSIKDFVSLSIEYFFELYFPFIVGFTFLNTISATQKFVKIFFVLGVVYAFLMLWEIRMSPKLHLQIYGFFPHDWAQQKRAGGFRSIVFLGHGLLTAMLVAQVCICTYLMLKFKAIKRGKLLLAFSVLIITLILNKTYSAIIYFLFVAVIFVFVKSAVMRLRIALIISVFVCLFPLIRGYMPLAEVVEFFEGMDPDRAQSLQFRIDNEDELLSRANERPLFGWGSWARNRIFHPVTGNDLSVVDGVWILKFGVAGWFGYLAFFGLLTYAIFMIYRLSKTRPELVDYSTYSLVFILAITLFDQIPNSSSSHITFLIAGCLLGCAKELNGERMRKNMLH